MEGRNFVIGLDIGTTSTKATIFTTDGRVVSSKAIEYPIIHPKIDWAEQDPDVIYQATLDSIRLAIEAGRIEGSQFIGIGISSAMHSLIAIDAAGNRLTNSIIWADNRSIDYAKQLKEENGHDIYLRTGTPIHPMSPLTKLLWMRNERPDIFQNTAKWISIKEYVMWKWFDQFVVDYSIASTSGLFNLQHLDWDEEVLEMLNITRDHLSTPVPTTEIFKGMNTEASEYIGIPNDIPVVIGASDGVLANLGVGAIDKGEFAVTIGTSGAIRTVVDKPLTDPKGRTFCYALTEDHWVIGGPINNGGVALRWFKDQFSSKEVMEAEELDIDSYERMIERASEVSAGSNGLIFLPYLSGERAPFWNANTRGVFFGISLTHQREHFIRAVLEGVVYAVYSVGQAMKDLSGIGTEIRVSGGFARSEEWRQIMADVFGQDVVVPESHESSGLGAVVLTMYALGLIDSLSEVKNMLHVSAVQKPKVENSKVYGELYPLYEKLYYSLEEPFEIVADFQRKHQ